MGEAVLIHDFEQWQRARRSDVPAFSFFRYPFLLSMGAKVALLSFESKRTMESRATRALAAGGTEAPVLVLQVRRSNIVQDSLEQVCRPVQLPI